jgi:hypothetical protein
MDHHVPSGLGKAAHDRSTNAGRPAGYKHGRAGHAADFEVWGMAQR